MTTARQPASQQGLQQGPRPRVAVVEITNLCNLRCLHCGSSSGDTREAELSCDELRRLLDELVALGCERVTLLGGEIFLREDWYDIASHAKQLGMKLVLITNGLLLDDARLEQVVRLSPYVVGVSLDGSTERGYQRVRGGDGFRAALQALERLCATGLTGINAITTFHRLNLPEFESFPPLFRGTIINWQVQIAGKGGARFPSELFFSQQDYVEFARKVLAAEQLQDLRLTTMDDFGYFPLREAWPRLQSWSGCLAGIQVVGVRSNGGVLPCLSLGDDFVVSNLRKETLTAIWNNETYFRPFRRKHELLTGECAVCPERLRCRGGCSAIAHSATGNLFEDPYCLRALESKRILNVLLQQEPQPTTGKGT